MTLVEDGKTDFIQGGGAPLFKVQGPPQWGLAVEREIRGFSEYCMDKWEFITKEQSGGQRIENY